MVENSPINRPISGSQVPPVDGAGAAQEAKQDPSVGKGGPAFQALLEKLQAQARSLQHDSENVDKPEELTEAVDRARSSLSDALSLSDQLLEAYREASQRETPPTDGAPQPGDEG